MGLVRFGLGFISAMSQLGFREVVFGQKVFQVSLMSFSLYIARLRYNYFSRFWLRFVWVW